MSSQVTSLEFLNPVTDKEATDLLDIVMASPYPATVKKENSDEFKTTVVPRTNSFQVNLPDGFSVNSGEEVILALVEGREKYVLQGRVVVKNEALVFGPDMEIRKVQRRENFRVQILGKIKVYLSIQELAGNTISEEYPILDLSYGGCQIEVSNMEAPFSPGATLSAEIQCSELAAPLKVSGIVRRSIENEKFQYRKVGIQFDPHGRGVESVLMDLIMKCSRETQKYLAT